LLKTKFPTLKNNVQVKDVSKQAIFPWIQKIITPKRVIWLIPIIALFLTLPSLFSGYVADDHILKELCSKESAYNSRPFWDIFNFVSSEQEIKDYREQGILGWWAPDEFRVRFFKPLSSSLHALSFHFFGNQPWIQHLGMSLLYTALVTLTILLYRRFSKGSIAIGLSALLFAVDDTHALSAGWIASLNTILTCLIGLGALLAHHRWREKNWHFGAFLGLLLYILSFTASEGGIALMGYLIAYALFIDKNSLVKRVSALVPYFIVSLLYVSAYSYFDRGTIGSEIYRNLFGDVGAGILYIFNNGALMIFSQILSIPPLSMAIADLPGIAVFCTLLLGGLAWIFRDFFKNNRVACFYGAGMIISVVPFTLSGTQDRSLLFSSFGAAGLIGELWVYMENSLKKRSSQRRIGSLLIVSNLFISLLLFIPSLFFYFMLQNTAIKIEQAVLTENTIIVNSPMDVFFMFPPAFRTQKGQKWPEQMYLLYSGFNEISVKRIDEKTIEIVPKSGWFSTDLERFSRSSQFPFNQNDAVKLEGMKTVINECTPDGRPKSVLFIFENGIDQFKWLSWGKDGPSVWNPPKINETIRLTASLF
jgi:hypothetical protein